MPAHSDAHRLLSVLKGMRKRCYQKTHIGYRYYGARGISICKEWLDSPASFITWSMQNSYSIGLEIDRINGDGNYEPSNCRWVTREANQSTRKRRRAPTVVGGVKMPTLKGMWKTATGKWRAGIKVRGKLIGLGSFESEHAAAIAYDEAARRFHGERAELNFPDRKPAANGV